MGLQNSVYPFDVPVETGLLNTSIPADSTILLAPLNITKELLQGSTGLFRVYFALDTSDGTDYELEINRKRSKDELGVDAAAIATISNGKVDGITIANTGDGYPQKPFPVATAIIKFDNTGTGGTDAAATPIINRGQIVNTVITNGGSGYTKPPLVAFESSATAASGENLKLNADNNFVLKSGGYYRFDIGVRVGDIVDFVYRSSQGVPPTITNINEFRIDQVQIGA